VTRTRTAVAIGISVAVLFGTQATATTTPTTTRCFPAATWSADDGQRPCYRITRPAEDGSGRLVLGTAAQAQATCVIPNVAEEPRRFAIRCTR
jgi:hypothetical protein